ncbi:MAG TPA: GNAT family N-acetyltransferase [Candidatus Kapabacteria bacterium]|jgi:GNAT superfamily N-acetyltransferase
MAETYTIRLATINDVPAIAEHRKKMIAEIRDSMELDFDSMVAQFQQWLRPRMERGEYMEWFAMTENGSVAAGIGLWIIDWPPHLLPSGNANNIRGYILNVFTEPSYRKQGVSRLLLETALDWCREKKIKMVFLHASPFGRHLYETAGFMTTNEMRIYLE